MGIQQELRREAAKIEREQPIAASLMQRAAEELDSRPESYEAAYRHLAMLDSRAAGAIGSELARKQGW